MMKTLLALLLAGSVVTAQESEPIVLLIFDGNSLTQSRGGVPAFPDLIDLTRMGPSGSVVPSANVGAMGTTTEELDALASLSIDIANPVRMGGESWVVFWEGSNALYRGASAAEAFAQLQQYSTRRRARGFQVAMLTLLPRSDEGTPIFFEANRQVVNARMRAAGSQLCDLLIDVAKDPKMGYSGAEMDERFFLPDRVHLAVEGAKTIAGYVAAALASRGAQ